MEGEACQASQTAIITPDKSGIASLLCALIYVFISNYRSTHHVGDILTSSPSGDELLSILKFGNIASYLGFVICALGALGQGIAAKENSRRMQRVVGIALAVCSIAIVVVSLVFLDLDTIGLEVALAAFTLVLSMIFYLVMGARRRT